MNKKATKKLAHAQLFSLEAYLLTKEVKKQNKHIERHEKKGEHIHS